MPEESSGGSSDTYVPSQLASLVPSFDPSKDDLQTYANKVSLLAEAWPAGKYTELVTRLILNCTGSAFLKLQLKQSELLKNEKSSVQALVEVLGGHWGRIGLERKYEYAERALYKCSQRSDENADSYLARADITWSDLNSQKMALSSLQAYVALRGSNLTSEDKKRVLLDADSKGDGSLGVQQVTDAIKMLGAGFFHEMTGQKKSRGKTYDQATLTSEGLDEELPHDALHAEGEDFLDEDEAMDVLLSEGDMDAALISEFESAAADLIQSDEELASALNSYTEARKRLSEKIRFRGFWPISQKGKGKSKSKGKVKGKFGSKGGYNRKSLEQRILTSRCKICDEIGHWKAECPHRGSAGSAPAAPTTFVSLEDHGSSPMPLEFLNIPEDKTLDDTQTSLEPVFFGVHNQGHKHQIIDIGDYRARLRGLLNQPHHQPANRCHTFRNEATDLHPEPSTVTEPTFFATHGSYGVVDLGATKTVIGSDLVKDLIQNLSPEVQKTLTRRPCKITFRFGNHGTLQSEQALVVPLNNLKLKIAIVPGSTPFLISNTLLRALKAVIDVDEHTMWSKKLQKQIPIELTGRGLFLLDLNQLALPERSQAVTASDTAETHLSTDTAKQTPAAVQFTDREKSVHESSSQSEHVDQDIGHNNNATCQSASVAAEDESHSYQVQDHAPSSDISATELHHALHQRSPQEASSACRGELARSGTPVPGRNGRDEGGLWSHTQRQDVSSGLGRRSEMDLVVCQPLSGLSQVVTPNHDPLHHLQDRTCRARQGAHCGARAQPDTSDGSRIPTASSQDDGFAAQGEESSNHFRASGGIRKSGDESTLRCRLGSAPAGLDDDSHAHEQRCHPPRGPHAEHGECAASDDAPCREPGPPDPSERSRAVGAALTSADTGNHDHVNSESPETCRERKLFQRLVHNYSNELQDIQHASSAKQLPARLDLLEVFCGSRSQLTHQGQMLGFNTKRLGLEQCDLQTKDGRKVLFQSLIQERPKQLWYSPTCGPWSGWSSLNASRSLQAWDELHRTRLEHISQIALGIVVLRHQLQTGNHMHWEQTRPSQMFKLPYLSELYYYTVAVDFDMCVAGNLKDPQTQLPIRKAMTVMTTSKNLVRCLENFKCTGTHVHQQIEGTTKVDGVIMNRSTFTENYPRKFARMVVRNLCKHRFQKEPLAVSLWCSTDDVILTSEQARKRRRLITVAKPKPSRSSEVTHDTDAKRRKLQGKQTVLSNFDKWSKMFDQVDALLPRVGKLELKDAGLIQSLQELMPDKTIKFVVACRGSNRTMGPPKNTVKGEAPFRKCAYIQRGTQQMFVEDQWEDWEMLSQRQLIRTSHLCRINIMAFATNPEEQQPTPVSPEPPEAVSNFPSHQSSVVQKSEGNSPTPPEAPPEASEANDELTEHQHSDLQSEKQTPHFSNLPKHEQLSIIKWHKNLGHPSPERFASVLQQQGCRPEMYRAAKEYQCSVCQQAKGPRHARPATLKDDTDFNDRIAVDQVTWTNKNGTKFQIFHIVDCATNFHVAQIAPSKTSESVIQNLIQSWLCWAGAPGEIMMDAGTELNSEEFSNFLQANNIRPTTVCPEAHYQNGKIERHGAILQNMLTKFEIEHPIENYQDLQKALWWSTQAKNACGLKRGYAPEVLVLGKHTRLPGAVSSDHLLPAHRLADSDTSQGILFRKQLAMRETARRAFHSADNDSALRKALLRRSNPHRGTYQQGEWVMIWRHQNGEQGQGNWLGPMKVVIQEGSHTVWTTMTGKLFRSSPENVRPLTAHEAREIVILPNEPSMEMLQNQVQQTSSTTSGSEFPIERSTDAVQPNNTLHPPNPIVTDQQPVPIPTSQTSPTSESQGQPDQEPDTTSTPESNSNRAVEPQNNPESPNPVEVPIPESEDEDLICEGLYCLDADTNALEVADEVKDLAWKCEILISDTDIQHWRESDHPEEMAFVVSAAKKQRAEVRLNTLNHQERLEFDKAKQSEVQNWLKTETVKKILRSQLSEDQILRCRWILTWKPLDAGDIDPKQPDKKHKAKARLVVLGYLI